MQRRERPGRGRRSTSMAAGVVAAGTLGAGAAAHALETGPGVRPDRNITVFHNIDFVATFGHEAGAPLRVDLLRGPHRVATSSGPAVGTPEGGALEVNHGVDGGAAAPGDCWEAATPDVEPGDRVVVTEHPGTPREVVSEVTVDELRFTAGPELAPDGSTVTLQGVARQADGTAIDPAELDSGEVRDTVSRLRAAPTSVTATPGMDGGWTATYAVPYEIEPGKQGTADDQPEQTAAILRGDHAMGFGHLPIVPAPPSTFPLRPTAMLLDGLDETHAPALGCEAATAQRNTVGTTDHSVLDAARLAGGPDARPDDGLLRVGGAAAPGVGRVDVALTDGTAEVTRTGVVPEAADLAPAPTPGRPLPQQGWSAAFTRAEVAGLRDGLLTVRAVFDGVASPVERTVVKDVVAPELRADPPAGTYVGAQRVRLVAPGGETIRFRRDGTPAGSADEAYDGTPIILEPGTRAISAQVVDAAGNVTAQRFDYEVRRATAAGGDRPGPGAPGAGGQARPDGPVSPVAAGGSGVTVAAGSSSGRPGPAPLRLRRLVVGARLGERAARRSGLRVVAWTQDGTRVLRVRVLRIGADGIRRPVFVATRGAVGTGPHRLRLMGVALRRALRAGSYTVEVTPGRAPGSLGTSRSVRVRIMR